MKPTSNLIRTATTLYHRHQLYQQTAILQKVYSLFISTSTTNTATNLFFFRPYHSSFSSMTNYKPSPKITPPKSVMVQNKSSSTIAPIAVATADLCDDFVTSPDRLKVAQPFPKFYNYGRITSFYGEIYTIRCFESNPLVRKTLSEPGNGRVLVVDGGASERVAILGDELAKLARDNNWAGVVINGCIRDSKVIGTMNVGVKALGTHPLKSIKKHVGEGGVIVSFSGVEFVPGHWLYSDEDGIVLSEKPIHTPPASKL